MSPDEQPPTFPTDPSRAYLQIVANGLRDLPPAPWSHEQLRNGVRIWGHGENPQEGYQEHTTPIAYSSADITVWSWILGARDEVPELAAAVTAVLDVVDGWAGSDWRQNVAATQIRDAIHVALHPVVKGAK